MKEVIDKYKQRNGDGVYTLKEMLMYTVERVDGIYDKLEIGAGKIASNRTKVNALQWIIGISIILFSGVIGWIVTKIV